MKKVISILIAVILPLFSLSAIADPDYGVTLPVEIHNSTNRPTRGTVYIPLTCTYESLSGGIVTVFAQNIGMINITITNTNTGNVINDVVDSSNGQALTIFSGASGNYVIDYTLLIGTTYEGDFEI